MPPDTDCNRRHRVMAARRVSVDMAKRDPQDLERPAEIVEVVRPLVLVLLVSRTCPRPHSHRRRRRRGRRGRRRRLTARALLVPVPPPPQDPQAHRDGPGHGRGRRKPGNYIEQSVHPLKRDIALVRVLIPRLDQLLDMTRHGPVLHRKVVRTWWNETHDLTEGIADVLLYYRHLRGAPERLEHAPEEPAQVLAVAPSRRRHLFHRL
mmetsp:Transcript_40275/g.95704  ORF Transcript_40275/g.95704 Transcript_40275/m.95704 type:complete len:207 (+) Transcript_40275:729-1349(+)